MADGRGRERQASIIVRLLARLLRPVIAEVDRQSWANVAPLVDGDRLITCEEIIRSPGGNRPLVRPSHEERLAARQSALQADLNDVNTTVVRIQTSAEAARGRVA